MSKHPGYEYKYVNVKLTAFEALKDPTFPSIVETTNHWASEGWRIVTIVPPQNSSRGYMLLIERRKQNPHNKCGESYENQRWNEWEAEYGES